MRTLFIGPYAHNLGSHNSLACWRIVQWICRNVEDCHFIQYGDFSNTDGYKNVKNVVYFYSSFYAKFDEIILLMEKNPQANLYWLYNEYTLALNSSIMRYFKTRGYSVITNLMEGCAKDITQTAKKIHKINTNITAYRDNIYERSWDKRPFDLIYYGSYRLNRKKYVDEYFSDAYISTTEKNEKFFLSKCNVQKNNFIGILKWNLTDLSHYYKIKSGLDGKKIYPKKNMCTLDMFKFSVYIEDEAIHQNNFNNLSDRFYECISHGVILFFDENCRYNVSKSKYKIPDYFFVSNKNDLAKKMKEMDNDQAGRQEYFDTIKKIIKVEKEEFREEIRNILNEK